MLDTNIGFNTQLYNFKNDLVNTINKSGLPVGIAYYIIKDLFMEIQNAYETTLKNEKNVALMNSTKEETEKIEEEIHDDSKKTKSTCKKTER